VNDPYEEIYSVSHHQEYWRLIHGEWLQPHAEKDVGVEKSANGEWKARKEDSRSGYFKQLNMYISDAREVHSRIGPYSHPRTIQLFSNGKHETITEICWLAQEITKHVLEAPVEKYSRDDKPLRYLRDLTIVPDYNRFGKYGEVRWRVGDGPLGEVVKGGALLATLQKRIREEGLRLYLLRMTEAGETVPGITDHPVCHQGDGTVPLSSATAMKLGMEAWGECAHLLPVWFAADRECRPCTGQVNQEVHAAFFVDEEGNALRAVKKAVHNLCIGWLKGEFT